MRTEGTPRASAVASAAAFASAGSLASASLNKWRKRATGSSLEPSFMAVSASLNHSGESDIIRLSPARTAKTAKNGGYGRAPRKEAALSPPGLPQGGGSRRVFGAPATQGGVRQSAAGRVLWHPAGHATGNSLRRHCSTAEQAGTAVPAAGQLTRNSRHPRFNRLFMDLSFLIICGFRRPVARQGDSNPTPFPRAEEVVS